MNISPRIRMVGLAGVLAVLAACGSDKAAPPSSPPAAAPKLSVRVTTKGFEPDRLMVPGGAPVILEFTRTTNETCAKQVVVEVGGGQKVTRELPLDQAVAISATFATGGELRYACGMDMISGVISVR